VCSQGTYRFVFAINFSLYVVRELTALCSQGTYRFVFAINFSLYVVRESISLCSEGTCHFIHARNLLLAVAWYLSPYVFMELKSFVFRRNFRLCARKDLIASGGKIIKTKNTNSYRGRTGSSVSLCIYHWQTYETEICSWLGQEAHRGASRAVSCPFREEWVNRFKYPLLVLRNTIFWTMTPCSLVKIDFIFRRDIIFTPLGL
jgi:hypothetical protein